MTPNEHRKLELKALYLAPFLKYLNDHHGGDINALCEWLNKTIYLLHYIPEGSLNEHERQNACYVLMQLKKTFMEIHKNKLV